MSDGLAASGSPLAIGAVSVSESDLLSVFLSGRGGDTTRAYRRDLDDFASFLGAESARDAVAALLSGGAGEANRRAVSYRAHLLAKGLSPATVNRRLSALRSIVTLARQFGQISWSLETPSVRSESYKDTRGPGRESIEKVLARLGRETTLAARRDTAILRLLFDLGLRRAEVCALDLADIDLARSALWVLGKGLREKTLLSLPDPTRAALAAWIVSRGDFAGALFGNFDPTKKGDGRLSGTSVYRIVRARGASVGAKMAPHGLRHTAITEACKAAAAEGIGLEEVRDFSRHKSIDVLLRYRDRERNVQGRLAAAVAGNEERSER